MLAKVKARDDLRETAFFYPHLRTNKKGEVTFSFTTPEALTRWKLQLLAHNKDLKVGYRELTAITQKELMVAPNAPRFLRKNDRIVFFSKIVNLTDQPQQVQVELALSDGQSGKDITARMVKQPRQMVSIPAGNSRTVDWTFDVPEEYEAIQYKVVATNGTYSDGEQKVLPVLSNRQLVTETLPIVVKGNTSGQFELEKLKNSQSSTLTHHQLVLEVTANPIWYVIKSLPYLMEYPYECSEQTFARLYANVLAQNLVSQHPEIKKVFEAWRSSGALVSNLEKNAELRALLIQETPWLREAQSESEQQKRIALLFDLENVAQQSSNTFKQLYQMQFDDGGFPWFNGSRYPNRYISQHIMAGLGHLQHIGIPIDFDEYVWMVKSGVKYLDRKILEDYQRLMASDVTDSTKKYVNPIHIHYLYARSFFDQEFTAKNKAAHDFYLQQSADHWTAFGLMTKAMIALIQHRAGNTDVAQEILHSLLETSISSDDKGMYWKANIGGYTWYDATIETQAMIVEAFHEALPDSINDKSSLINQMQNWLLMHKQVNQWPTTKATTEAVYAMLLDKTEISTMNAVKVSQGDELVIPEGTEAGSGYFKRQWQPDAISPDMARVSVANQGENMVWVNVYWQYFEQLNKITTASTSALSLSKEVFKVGRDAQGEVLTMVGPSTSLQLGDLLRIRIELKADRGMEFLHLKDQRASGLEPTTTLSRYKWQDGLGYYHATKDASTNFFIDDLPKGIYVFEYDLRVNNEGTFSNGITTIQNMYAPQYSSHSEGASIQVGKE